MSQSNEEEDDKSHDPTPQKLLRAREKGEIARSADLLVAASYSGLMLAALLAGPMIVDRLGSALMSLLERAARLSEDMIAGPSQPILAQLGEELVPGLLPVFAAPIVTVLAAIAAQRAFVFAPSRLAPKLSKISLISNAKNKFGRSGLFEFLKSFLKLALYSVCLAAFLRHHLPDIVAAAAYEPAGVVVVMAELCLGFLFVICVISLALGGIDAVWQHFDHVRKNRMSRKEVMDEMKEAEGDPHMKQERRFRGQEIAMQRMLADVPSSDVVIVNPTHYAVALTWSRLPGSAPVCVAKGVDQMAATIRQTAQEAGVPIHSDPATARALHGTVAIGDQIDPDHYRAVAAAIRFAEMMRKRAKGSIA